VTKELLVKPALALVALIALACDSSRSSTPDNARSIAVRQRLARGNEEFSRVLLSGPRTQVHVLMSFTEPRRPDDAIREARHHSLTITGFRHASLTNSGGYTLVPGESVDDAMKAYRRDSEIFTRMRLGRMEQLAPEALDPEMKDAYERQAKDASQRLSQLEASGVLISGIEAIGVAADVDSFRQATDFVRGIELQQGSRRNASVPFYVE
jgi:hypothetical protein